MVIVGDVTGKLCIIIDDIADTCRTLTSASKLLTLKGATRIVAFITHGILSGNSLQHLQDSDIDEVIVSNSVAQGSNMKKCSKVKVMDITPIFAEAIRRIHNGESVSFLFESVPY